MAILSPAAFWLSVVLVITLILYLRGIFRFLFLTSKIRGPSIWEMITVHSRQITRRKILSYMCKMCEDFSYKPWRILFFNGACAVVVSDPETFQEIYKNRHLDDKPDEVYGTLMGYTGKGLLFINGDLWRRHRKMVNAAFNKSLLETNLNIVFERAEDFLKVVDSRADGSSFDISDLLDDYLLDLQTQFLCSNNTVFRQIGPFNQTIRHVTRMATLKLMNPFYHWFLTKFNARIREFDRKFRAFYSVAQSEMKNLIAQSKIRLQNHNPPRNALDWIVKGSEENGILDELELADQVLHVIFGAAEPVSMSLRAAILMLALNQDVQQRLFEELKGYFEDNNRPSFKDLDRIEYMGMVIKESLRFFPSGSLILRTADEDTVLNGMEIPKGTRVMLNIFALHRNPNNFKNSLQFLPERFSPEYAGDRHQLYVPFSSGSRACVGQLHGLNVIKVMLSYLVKSYWILPGDGLNSVSDVKIALSMTLSIDETPIKLIRRHD